MFCLNKGSVRGGFPKNASSSMQVLELFLACCYLTEAILLRMNQMMILESTSDCQGRHNNASQQN